MVVALVNDKNISGKNGFTVSDLVIDLTSGFEASTAELSLYGVYDIDKGQFQFDRVKNTFCWDPVWICIWDMVIRPARCLPGPLPG